MPQERVKIPPPITAELPTPAQRATWSEDELGARAQLIGLVHRPDRSSYYWRAPRWRWLGWLPVIPVPQKQWCSAPGCGQLYPCAAAQWSARAYGLDAARM